MFDNGSKSLFMGTLFIFCIFAVGTNVIMASCAFVNCLEYSVINEGEDVGMDYINKFAK